jgi:hypothetical protein
MDSDEKQCGCESAARSREHLRESRRWDSMPRTGARCKNPLKCVKRSRVSGSLLYTKPCTV